MSSSHDDANDLGRDDNDTMKNKQRESKNETLVWLGSHNDLNMASVEECGKKKKKKERIRVVAKAQDQSIFIGKRVSRGSEI
jgi:hypothetical protein